MDKNEERGPEALVSALAAVIPEGMWTCFPIKDGFFALTLVWPGVGKVGCFLPGDDALLDTSNPKLYEVAGDIADGMLLAGANALSESLGNAGVM